MNLTNIECPNWSTQQRLSTLTNGNSNASQLHVSSGNLSTHSSPMALCWTLWNFYPMRVHSVFKESCLLYRFLPLFLHHSFLSKTLAPNFQLPSWTLNLPPQFSKTTPVCLGFPSLNHSLEQASRQKARVITELISFVYLVSGTTIMYDLLSNVWKHLFYI